MDKYIDRLYYGHATLIELGKHDLECSIEHEETICQLKKILINDLDEEARTKLNIIEDEITKLNMGYNKKAFFTGFKFGTELSSNLEVESKVAEESIESKEKKKYSKILYENRMNNYKYDVMLRGTRLNDRVEDNCRNFILKSAGVEITPILNKIEDAISELILNDHEEAFYVGLKFGSKIASTIIEKERGVNNG